MKNLKRVLSLALATVMLLGIMATINAELDFDTAQLVCSEFEEQGGMYARQHRCSLHGHGYALCAACQYAVGDGHFFSAVGQEVSPQRLAILPRAAHLHVGPARAFL